MKLRLTYKCRNVTKFISKLKELSMCLTCRAAHHPPDKAACVCQQTSSPSTITDVSEFFWSVLT